MQKNIVKFIKIFKCFQRKNLYNWCWKQKQKKVVEGIAQYFKEVTFSSILRHFPVAVEILVSAAHISHGDMAFDI